MARIISFAWTSPALLASAKTVTRRMWDDDYGARFKAGMEVLAYDRSPRHHGRPIARLRLTDDARLEADSDAPDGDYEAEGFAWLAEHPTCLPKSGRLGYLEQVSRESFDAWRRMGGRSWVVRFDMLELL